MNLLILITPTQLMIVILLNIVAAFPCCIILKRLGFNGWWSLASFVPAVAIVFLWYLAFSRWPSVENANAPEI